MRRGEKKKANSASAGEKVTFHGSSLKSGSAVKSSHPVYAFMHSTRVPVVRKESQTRLCRHSYICTSIYVCARRSSLGTWPMFYI